MSADAQYWALRAVKAAAKAAQERALHDEYDRRRTALNAANTDLSTKLEALAAARSKTRCQRPGSAPTRRITDLEASIFRKATARSKAHQDVEEARAAVRAAEKSVLELRKSNAETWSEAGSAMRKHKRESDAAQENWERLAWHALLTRRRYGPAPGTVVGGAPCWEEAKASAEAQLLGAHSASAAVLIA
jgi:hypothetical protein